MISLLCRLQASLWRMTRKQRQQWLLLSMEQVLWVSLRVTFWLWCYTCTLHGVFDVCTMNCKGTWWTQECMKTFNYKLLLQKVISSRHCNCCYACELVKHAHGKGTATESVEFSKHCTLGMPTTKMVRLSGAFFLKVFQFYFLKPE